MQVIFEFAHQIDIELAEELQEIGVVVSVKNEALSGVDQLGNQISAIGQDLSNFDTVQRVDTLNLDVTTLLAYVSAMTNGSSNWEYAEPILTEQACCERKNPVKATLDKIFDGKFVQQPLLSNLRFFYSNLFLGKRLICCETASSSFAEICQLLGGEGEKIRANEFMQRVEVLPDALIPIEMTKLNVGGKIKERSLVIFSFGIAHKALTVTANEGFIRSARMQVCREKKIIKKSF